MLADDGDSGTKLGQLEGKRRQLQEKIEQYKGVMGNIRQCADFESEEKIRIFNGLYIKAYRCFEETHRIGRRLKDEEAKLGAAVVDEMLGKQVREFLRSLNKIVVGRL